jgi:hypothetical protein
VRRGKREGGRKGVKVMGEKKKRAKLYIGRED